MKIGKYIFDSREAAQTKIDALGTATDEDGNEYATHKNTIVHLGNIILSNGEYDEEGNETVAPILSTDWHVDVLWSDLQADADGSYSHPYGWAGKAVNIDGNGVHAFFGLDYNSLKIN